MEIMIYILKLTIKLIMIYPMKETCEETLLIRANGVNNIEMNQINFGILLLINKQNLVQ